MDVIKDLPVNDGGGLMDNIGMIDSLIVDCNNMTKALVSGNYVQYASINVGMVQKLVSLKKGVKHDMDGLLKQIEDLKGVINHDIGSVYNTLQGTVGDMLEGVRDAEDPKAGGLEPSEDHGSP